MSSDSTKLLSVEEAARLVGVSPGTIRNWVKTGTLLAETDGESARIDYAVLAERKLLRETDLLALPSVKSAGVVEADVPTAIVEGIISPTEAPDRRFSIRDGEAISAWKRGVKPEPEKAADRAPQPPPEAVVATRVPLEWGTDRSGRFEVLIEYMVRHGDPAKLPPIFWDTRVCPEFIPPVGVYRAWYGGCGSIQEEDDTYTMRTVIARSAVWVLEQQQLIRLPDDDEFLLEDGVHPAGSDPPTHASMNLRYRELNRVWDEAYYQRLRELRALGVDVSTLREPLMFEGRDRVAAISRYHREHLTPADLPDWYFLTDEPPPFVPPTGVFRFEYGECVVDPHSGEARTWIRSSAGWAQECDQSAVTFVPANDACGSEPGAFPKGATPAYHAAANLRYDLAAQQWHEEWRLRQKRYRGDPDAPQ